MVFLNPIKLPEIKNSILVRIMVRPKVFTDIANTFHWRALPSHANATVIGGAKKAPGKFKRTHHRINWRGYKHCVTPGTTGPCAVNCYWIISSATK